ncbi:MAG: pyridoxamine 5'-phosphate oxidase family protein [Pseudomonadota bacterium]
MSEWYETLSGLLDMTWARLKIAASDADVVSLATVSISGAPEVRSVVLRRAVPDAGAIEIYTDLQSTKITSLTRTPQASLLLWDATLKLQIRTTGTVTILTGDTVRGRWDAVPDHSRLSYGITPPPGQEIVESTAYLKEPNPSVFAVLVCNIDNIDVVHLGRPHRRANFTRSSSNNGDWDANWLAP